MCDVRRARTAKKEWRPTDITLRGRSTTVRRTTVRTRPPRPKGPGLSPKLKYSVPVTLSFFAKLGEVIREKPGTRLSVEKTAGVWRAVLVAFIAKQTLLTTTAASDRAACTTAITILQQAQRLLANADASADKSGYKDGIACIKNGRQKYSR